MAIKAIVKPPKATKTKKPENTGILRDVKVRPFDRVRIDVTDLKVTINTDWAGLLVLDFEKK